MGGKHLKTKSKKITQYWLKDSVWVGKTIIFRLRKLLVVVLLGLFLPWRQNIEATDKVITRGGFHASKSFVTSLLNCG